MLTEIELLAQDDEQYMSDDQVAFFKNRLLEKALLIRERLDEGETSVDWTQQADATDVASTAEMSRTLQSLADTARSELARVNQALKRINSGDYGFCMITDEPIGLRRLLAVPESVHTVESMMLIEAKAAHLR